MNVKPLNVPNERKSFLNSRIRLAALAVGLICLAAISYQFGLVLNLSLGLAAAIGFVIGNGGWQNQKLAEIERLRRTSVSKRRDRIAFILLLVSVFLLYILKEQIVATKYAYLFPDQPGILCLAVFFGWGRIQILLFYRKHQKLINS